MEILFLKMAIAALQADQIALHFLVRIGWLSGLLILVHNLKPVVCVKLCKMGDPIIG